MSAGARADRILTGAAVWTGAGGPPGAARPGTAVALRRGRILAVGPDEEVDGLRGPDTEVLPLEGRFVAPGFVDAHVHLLEGGLALSRVDLRGSAAPEEFIRRVADRARETPPGSWILGGDWNQADWGGALPSREWLDRAAPEHPVFLYRTDLHMGVAGSRALALAGVTAETPDPPNGIIDRDPSSGEPTGILREHAIAIVDRVIPPPSEQDLRAAVREGTRRALAGGITQVHDMGSLRDPQEGWDFFRLLRALGDEEALPLRVHAALPLADWREVGDLVGEEGRGGGRLRWGTVKGFVDGSLGASTAWFHEPYAHEPENHGTPISDLGELRKDLRGAVGRGLQPAVHAIGDRAGDWVFRVWDEIRADGIRPGVDVRFRMEHAQHLSPRGLAGSGVPGMILSVQPHHMVDDAHSVPVKLGADRERRSLAFRSMEEAGARLAFGSDWPVAPLEPVRTLQAAVTRVPGPAGEGGEGDSWVPNERLTPESALTAHSVGAARAAFLDGETGTLEAGKRGDLVVLSGDPFRIPPGEWTKELRVEMTFVDGEPAYRAPDSEADSP